MDIGELMNPLSNKSVPDTNLIRLERFISQVTQPILNRDKTLAFPIKFGANRILASKNSMGASIVNNIITAPEFSYRNSNQMELSPKSANLPVDRILSCKICKTEFKNSNALRRHLRSVHIDPEPCPYCTKLMKSQGRPDNNRKHLVRCLGFQELIQNIPEVQQQELLHFVVRELTAGRGSSLIQNKI